jgi:LPS-assembly protein
MQAIAILHAARGYMRACALAGLIATASLWHAPLALAAIAPTPAKPLVLEATDMGFDQQNAIVVARGDVEIVQGDYVLKADQITYYQNSNIIRAQGNVSVLQPSGDVLFADEMELTDDLKTGVVQAFKARLSDDSVFVAQHAVRENIFRTKLHKATYSPCHICKGEDPFWQLRAERVDLDEFNERITYNNAWMEMGGVPIFYIPRLSHPTPDADAKSGFLPAEYASNSQLGAIIRTPYYWRIAPNAQATITPWYTSEDGPVLAVDSEYLTDHGRHTLNFSATLPERRENSTGTKIDGHEFRGHIYALGSHHFDETWSVGYDINRTSDDTYLRRYGFGSQRSLFSRAYAQGVQGRNLLSVSALTIQGLRLADDPDTTPLVLPVIEGFYETTPNDFGLKFFTSVNAQSLTRELGADQHRLSNTLGAELPYITDNGQIFKLTTSVRTDLYAFNDVSIPGKTALESGETVRVLPTLALEWRYPLLRQMRSGSITIEPTILAVARPNGSNPLEITNEDSSVVELTDTNIFAIERFPGLDRIDSGSRFAYGIRSQYLSNDGESWEFLLGQSFNSDDDTPFPNSNKQGESFSDYIGRLAYRSEHINASYRFSLNKEDLNPNRSEFYTGLNYEGFSLQTSYLKLADNTFLGASEQIFMQFGFPIYEDLSGVVGLNRNLELNQNTSQNAGLYYQNECFTLSFNMLRNFTRDRDLEPSTDFTLRIGFKNLGEFGSD